MDDATTKAEQARVEKYIKKWKELLWLNEYRFKHEFHRTRRDKDIAEGKQGGVAAQVVVQWEYLGADFDWYLPNTAALADDELEEYVVHEFGHVLVAEMLNGKHTQLEERVVTRLSRILMDMAKEKQGEPAEEGQQPEND